MTIPVLVQWPLLNGIWINTIYDFVLHVDKGIQTKQLTIVSIQGHKKKKKTSTTLSLKTF